jgi:hypothetical protein
MSAELYATEPVARARWERAGASGEELGRLAAEHAQLTPQQRADLAAEIAGCSDGDLAAFLQARRDQQPEVKVEKLAPQPVSNRRSDG